MPWSGMRCPIGANVTMVCAIMLPCPHQHRIRGRANWHPSDVPAGHADRDGRDGRDGHAGRGFLSWQHAGDDVRARSAKVTFSDGAHFGGGQRFHLGHQSVVVVVSDAVQLVEGGRPR